MCTLTVDCLHLMSLLNEKRTPLAMFMDYNKDFTLAKNSEGETWVDNLLQKHPNRR